ncbi:ABC transporter substrate-binding protein [Actinopolymorpha pittospori]|uniref:Peptide/nickel transport system substrate-binding protein n=1 Tax=Actinopolymorpha pittospori TaxID=648752 RepID=A0A927MNI8_9ACTN|nr:peptide/nickel transport system substrate-binding protein [Actinopolymorpha pittospori]
MTATVSGCDLLSTDPSGEREGQPRERGASTAKGKEAPTLAALVKEGKLPPVAERLPEDPVVVQPNDRIGVYGGEWTSGILGPSDAAWLTRTVGYENLMRWDPAFQEVIPNVARSIEVEDGGRAFVVALRRGMKWSDGEDFTAEDLVFAYNEVLLNEDLFPIPPSMYVPGDTAGKIEQVDATTVRFTFPRPNSLFVRLHATPDASDILGFPRHYMEQFHQKFNPGVEALVDSEDQPSWMELLLAKSDQWQNKELPRLHAWVPRTVFGEGSRYIYERNPYYWKTDPEGSQLPYIDRLIYRYIADPQVMILAASNGDFDMQDRTINTLRDKPVLAAAREKGGYRFFDEIPSDSTACVIALNLNHRDPVKREIFGNRDFRVGLSYAMNRQEIIDSVYQRQGEPYQVAPRDSSPYYDEEMAKQYTKYDVDLANEHLDRAGFAKRDSAGFRLGPDGRRISFAVEVPTAYRAEWPDTMQLVRGHWRAVGIDMQVKNEDRTLWSERVDAGHHDAVVWQAEGGGWIEPLMRTDWYFPSTSESVNYAGQWMEWYQTRGEGGEEPPPPVRRQMELYDQIRETVDEGARDELLRQLLQIAKEFFFHIGTILMPPSYGIVKNNFHNVPREIPQSFLYPTPGPTNPEQYFISDE